jgi:hypothetical protein
VARICHHSNQTHHCTFPRRICVSRFLCLLHVLNWTWVIPQASHFSVSPLDLWAPYLRDRQSWFDSSCGQRAQGVTGCHLPSSSLTGQGEEMPRGEKRLGHTATILNNVVSKAIGAYSYHSEQCSVKSDWSIQLPFSTR